MANSYSSVTTQPAKIESDNPFLGKENKPAQRVSGASAPPTISQNSAPSSNTGVKFPTKLGAASGDDALGAEMPDNDETVAYVNKLIHRYELANENNESVIIDWLTFTMPLAAIHPNSHEMDLYRVGQYLSLMLQRCLGYGILDDVYRGPRHNYKRAFVLGEKGWGFVGLGGNNDTACISIAGSGLMAARDGWETMLHGFLMRMNARITRIDLALDLWKGGYHPQQAAEDYVNGKFVTGGRWPEARQEGNWLRQNGKGLTFYVGDDRNGYSQRVYEKGKQLRIQNSDWQRIEGTMTNGNKNVVPFDVLLSPTECFRKLYPVNAELIKGSESACRIKTKKIIYTAEHDASVNTIRRQFGKYLRVYRKLYGDKGALDLLQSQRDETPPRLKWPTFLASLPPSHRHRVDPEFLESMSGPVYRPVLNSGVYA